MKKGHKEKNESKLYLLNYLIFLMLTMTGSVVIALCLWASRTFNVNLNAIVNTMLNSLQGTSEDTIRPAVMSCVPWGIGTIVVWVLCLLGETKLIKSKKKKVYFSMGMVLAAVLYLGISILFVQVKYDFIDYFKNRNAETSLYADRYVDPRSIKLENKGGKRNLIYIYLESMENTYADQAHGGAQDVNYIPRLTELAESNVSFSPIDGVGGFQATDGATWTMGALFSTTSGVPFEFPVGNNDMSKQEQFASGIYTLGDFLHDEGYDQMFLCGSDGAFAGRKQYFEQHGQYQVYDYKKARKKGDIPKDYKVWWGFEDAKLYDIAKEQLTRMAAQDQPFNFTMLTVDTHHIGGYVCQLCQEEYEDVTANVVACADRQLGDFVDWVKEQDFYDNTTIVITGDHPRMDNHLVSGIGYGDRLVYNCIINPAAFANEISRKRTFSGMDMFPTTLAAMGYEIPGDRLGLGVNLFSQEQTLEEEFGVGPLDAELMKSSKYYIEHFAPELSYLIEDEFDSLATLYFYGNDFNADQFITTPIAKAGIAGWLIGDKMEADIPVAKKDREVEVKLHIQETFNGEQRIQLMQDGVLIGEVSAQGTCVVVLPVQVHEGHVRFTLAFPDAISSHALDEGNPDTNPLSLLMNSITVNEKEK